MYHQGLEPTARDRLGRENRGDQRGLPAHWICHRDRRAIQPQKWRK